ncbi:MAG: YdiU family protein [Defluviitaleaceae bacterium]|nr:YdiU family protein [Defluviitaleaceae bacterium]MCL2836915.1 YdiU family protein [Defluviitaleaceae bacterium]
MAGWNLEHTYSELPEIFFREQFPAFVRSPKMVVFNEKLAGTLGLDADKLREAPGMFAGSELPPGAKPIAQAYAGFQFGHFAMLGDGRAVLLGEQLCPDGRRFDIQLKGSGVTPFSRNGDGLAALAPMLREYIISEAMFHLGIPTTRSLAVVLTGKGVIRDGLKQGAVLTRVAASHIRVGTFNFISAYGTEDDLRKLADYSIRRHFPWLEGEKDKYLLLFRQAADRQASLISKWQLAGFVHGVMNTDNMAISGETIDYGPCAFMDIYDPQTVFSSIDTMGRYSYENQPKIGAWNLARLAEAMLPLFNGHHDEAVKLAQNSIAIYWDNYNRYWLTGMRLKLGLADEEPDDTGLISALLDLMKRYELDYTNTFRALANDLFMPETHEITAWNKEWRARIDRRHCDISDAFDLMNKHNPAVIPRNRHVEEALAAAESGDLTLMHSLLDALGRPYEESRLFSTPPEPALCGYKTFCGT